MGAGKHETQFVTELAPFVLIDNKQRRPVAYQSATHKRMHEVECDQLALIANGARMHAALWHGSIKDHDALLIEIDQCRDIRKRRRLQFDLDAINAAIAMHEDHQELCEIARECAIDNAYMHCCGTLDLKTSIIPVWYWSVI
jgi:hypothetical protein